MIKSKFIIAIAIFLFIIFSFGSLVSILTDWQWFSSLGLLSMFTRPILIQTAVFAAAFLFGSIFIFINLSILLGNILSPEIASNIYQSQYGEFFEKIKDYTKWVKVGISSLLGFIWASLFQGFWLRGVYFIFGEVTGITDPVYNNDLSFYFFRLPLYEHIVRALMTLSIFTLIAVFVLYFLRGFITWKGIKNNRGLISGLRSYKHLNILLGIVLLTMAANIFLSRYQILFSARGAVYGAGYIDYFISRNVYAALAVIGTLGFFISLVNLKAAKYTYLVFSLVLFIGISMIGGIAAQIVQATVVSPNELSRERIFIEHHLEGTRNAYGLGNIVEQTWELEGEENIQDDSGLQLHPDVIRNMRLLDYRPLRDVYSEAQAYRRYYQFHDIDIARYTIDGEYHQVMLSAREMDVNSLPVDAQTPVNRHLKYTHGYGLAMSPVGQLTEGGLPQYYIQDMPMVDNIGLNIERPEIYFGEMTNDFVLVNTLEQEFHYPGQDDIEILYQGETGIGMSFFNRLLFAAKEQSSFLLFSSEYTKDSQILIYRNIMERISKIAPFFEYDSDPYLTVADGKLYWIIDAYMTSSNYPYSRPFARSLNYIDNSVKVVVDAYSGEVYYYVVNENEPFTKALSKAFPDLFSDPSNLSPELQAQFRYPEQMFKVQAEMLKNYHMTNPVVFYNREDAWDTPTENYRGQSIAMEPYYATLSLPDSEQPEFVLMLPFTPVQRNNMISWLGARNDDENYGELILYRFPMGTHIYGPQQIESRIDQDPEISEQLSLWDTQGSNVIRGNLLIIPLKQGVLYIEPLYLQAQTSSFPEMRRVIAAWEEQVVMESTLELALAQLGLVQDADTPIDTESPVDTETPDDTDDLDDRIQDELKTIEELINRLIVLHNDSDEALRQGEWGQYGELQKEIKDLLERLEEELDSLLP